MAYSFPIDTIPPLVVGRRYIDYIMTSIPFVTNNSVLIDFTYASSCFVMVMIQM